jgi:hypothetical protein
MRTQLTNLVHAIEADEFGIIGTQIAERMLSAPTKRERKSALRQLIKLYRVAYPGVADSISFVSIGTDRLGTLILFFHLERLA